VRARRERERERGGGGIGVHESEDGDGVGGGGDCGVLATCAWTRGGYSRGGGAKTTQKKVA